VLHSTAVRCLFFSSTPAFTSCGDGQKLFLFAAEFGVLLCVFDLTLLSVCAADSCAELTAVILSRVYGQIQ